MEQYRGPRATRGPETVDQYNRARVQKADSNNLGKIRISVVKVLYSCIRYLF